MSPSRLAAFLAAICVSPVRAADVDFTRDVLPILSDKCFHCHGPDEQARKKKLRLDTPEGAARVLVAGKSAESELYLRVSSKDDDEKMPPPRANRPLTQKQIETLKAWIDGGAKWGQHWAFAPVGNPKPPASSPNPIDAYILDRLAKDGLKPSAPATKEAWLRRVSLDLTGFSPTPAEIDAFRKDSTPAAFENVVDRLLASPRYGERMAVDWLDVARFADTHGYQFDRFRPVWPYRDWVIGAFNKNLPFDQFATWQLAGDLLPNATKEQKLATAFNRLHVQNEEGGVVEEEFRVAYVSDRVTTFGTAFLGLTLECCRCHDHKYDPISQKDFYSLFAFFQNIDECGQTTYFTEATPVPALLLSTNEQDRKLAELARKIREKETEWPTVRNKAKGEFEAWLKRKPEKFQLTGSVGNYSLFQSEKGKVRNKADESKPGRIHESPKLTDDPPNFEATLDGENGFVFPGVGHFNRSEPFTLSIDIRPTVKTPRAVVIHHSKAPVDAGSRGYELLLEDGKVTVGLHHMWPGNSIKLRTKKTIPLSEFTTVTMTYDGSSRANGIAIYLDGKLAETEVIRDSLTKDITYGGGEPDLTIGYRFRDNGFKAGSVINFFVFNRAVSSTEAVYLSERPTFPPASILHNWFRYETLSKEQYDEMCEYYLSANSPVASEYRKQLHALRDEYRKLVEPIPEIMTMRELPTPKPAFLLKRGQYDLPGEPVSANTPSVLPPFPADAPRNRLALANWLTDRGNPLLARVTVNRLWQQMFGIGLVETSDNFGRQGSPPSHSELLDWIARDFAANGWDVKRALKQIALSATYQQTSRVTPELLAKDPTNTLLARYPATRLSAEMMRDQALAASGLLVEKLGGPSVKPYQPDGLWDMAMGKPRYDRSKGDDLYRRSLYTFWKRTMPHPQMNIFDAADRSVCTVKRQQTSTPLQALALLNDVQTVEAARVFAQRMLKEGGKETKDRVAWAFRTVTGREPGTKETEILTALFSEQRELFALDPKESEKLLAVGDKKADAALDKFDLAAGAVVCLAILNHDAAVMKR